MSESVFLGTFRHSARRDLTSAGLSDCFLEVLDLALSEARSLEGDGRPGRLRLRSLQQKSLDLSSHCYYCEE